MYDVIIIRYGEIGLKGDNINDFITQLVSNIERATSDLGDFEISTVYGRIFLYAESDQIEKIVERLVNVPGIISLSPAQRFRIGKKIDKFSDQDFEELKKSAVELFQAEVNSYPTTFKVETTRADKSFPIKSPELNCELGGEILKELLQIWGISNSVPFTDGFSSMQKVIKLKLLLNDWSMFRGLSP